MVKVGKYWRPSEGYAYITDGETWATAVKLPDDSLAARWHDTNDAPPEDEELSAEEALDLITGGDSDEAE